VLPAAHRLTDPTSFRAVVRSGRRAASGTLVVHVLVHPDDPGPGPRVGVVVSRAVGSAVTRNRVQRRLRHLVREQLDSLPASGALVIRALPAAATAGTPELRDDLVRCLRRATREVPAS
jgi:ribonuclease P protein component